MRVDSVDAVESGGKPATVTGWPTRLLVDEPDPANPDVAHEVVGVMGFGELEEVATLAAQLDADTTSASFLTDARVLDTVTAGEVYVIGDEVIYVKGVEPQTVVRGAALTTPASHASGAAVRRVRVPPALAGAASRCAERARINREQSGNVVGEDDVTAMVGATVVDAAAMTMLEPFMAPSGFGEQLFDRYPIRTTT